MQTINKLQAKLRYLAPNSKWGIDSSNLEGENNPDDDYHRIVDWQGSDPKPTVTQLNNVTPQNLSDAALDKEAEMAFIQSKAFKTLVKWIAEARGISMNQAREELKTIYKSW